jgi:hypothetical protein
MVTSMAIMNIEPMMAATMKGRFTGTDGDIDCLVQCEWLLEDGAGLDRWDAKSRRIRAHDGGLR